MQLDLEDVMDPLQINYKYLNGCFPVNPLGRFEESAWKMGSAPFLPPATWKRTV